MGISVGCPQMPASVAYEPQHQVHQGPRLQARVLQSVAIRQLPAAEDEGLLARRVAHLLLNGCTGIGGREARPLNPRVSALLCSVSSLQGEQRHDLTMQHFKQRLAPLTTLQMLHQPLRVGRQLMLPARLQNGGGYWAFGEPVHAFVCRSAALHGSETSSSSQCHMTMLLCGGPSNTDAPRSARQSQIPLLEAAWAALLVHAAAQAARPAALALQARAATQLAVRRASGKHAQDGQAHRPSLLQAVGQPCPSSAPASTSLRPHDRGRMLHPGQTESQTSRAFSCDPPDSNCDTMSPIGMPSMV